MSTSVKLEMWSGFRDNALSSSFVQNYSSYDVVKLVVISVGFCVLLSKAWRRHGGGKGEIPGRLGWPFLGETFAFLSATNSTKGCYEFVRLRRLWHGKWFKTRIFGKTHVFVPSPEGAKTIFSNDFVQFNKGYVKSMADAVGRRSLLCVPVESHKRIRRLLSDPFSMPSLAKFVTKFDKMVSDRLQIKAAKGESFRLLDFSMKVTFDSMCEMLMSVRDPSLLDEIQSLCDDVSNAMLSLPLMIPGTRYYKGIKGREKLMKVFGDMIGKRRSGEESWEEDFLQSMLCKDSLPPEERLEDEEIMDNLITLIIAGQTTTAAAIMWSVKFLNDNQQAQDLLREEQLLIDKNKPHGEALTLGDLNAMSYASKVMKETLRMSNVLLWFPRVALDDCRIEGLKIQKGWHVNIDATCIHYDPSFYKDPMQFNPSRFDERQKPYTYMPFGSGPRTCLGINMAKVTMLVFLHRLAGGYKWSVDDPDTNLEKKSHIPRLRSGCPITLIPIEN